MGNYIPTKSRTIIMKNLREQYARLFSGKPSTNDKVLIERSLQPDYAAAAAMTKQGYKVLPNDPMRGKVKNAEYVVSNANGSAHAYKLDGSNSEYIVINTKAPQGDQVSPPLDVSAPNVNKQHFVIQYLNDL